MDENGKQTQVHSDNDGVQRGKRPIILWIVPIYMLVAGILAFWLSWSDPFATSLSKLLGLASALVQFGSGALLLLGNDLGRLLYQTAIPIVIIAQVVYRGTVTGFNDDAFLFFALAPFVVYGLVVYLLRRAPARKWLTEAL